MMPRTERARSEPVHVWSDWVDDRAAIGELHALLDADERARAGRFRFERDRRRFGARRVFLRRVLAGYLGVGPALIRYRTSPMGRPELEPDCGVTFSTSHSDGLAIVAVARGRVVGVDLEYVRPIADALDLAGHFYSRREYEHLGSINETARSDEFLRLWTRKESCVKALGGGMSIPFDELDVLEPDSIPAERHRVTNGGTPFVLASLDGHPGYVGSLAASGTEVTLEHMAPMTIAS